jgi:hypothetical protein
MAEKDDLSPGGNWRRIAPAPPAPEADAEKAFEEWRTPPETRAAWEAFIALGPTTDQIEAATRAGVLERCDGFAAGRRSREGELRAELKAIYDENKEAGDSYHEMRVTCMEYGWTAEGKPEDWMREKFAQLAAAQRELDFCRKQRVTFEQVVRENRDELKRDLAAARAETEQLREAALGVLRLGDEPEADEETEWQWAMAQLRRAATEREGEKK